MIATTTTTAAVTRAGATRRCPRRSITTTITGPFFASLLLGVADVAGKYYVPAVGGFIIYTIMVAVLILRPQGLFTKASR